MAEEVGVLLTHSKPVRVLADIAKKRLERAPQEEGLIAIARLEDIIKREPSPRHQIILIHYILLVYPDIVAEV